MYPVLFINPWGRNMNIKVLITCVIAALLSTGTAQAGSRADIKEIKEDIESLRQGQDQIRSELAEIKKLLQQGTRAPAGQQRFVPQDVQLGEAAYMGNIDAPVTLIEYSDYQCPYCRRHATTVMPQLIESYVNSGKLRFVMREYPIPKLHSRAVAASEAALCAEDQDQYWAMHDALFLKVTWQNSGSTE